MRYTFTKRFVWMLVVGLSLSSCLKEGDKTILVNDPQDIPFITDYLPEDLLNLFGEENVFSATSHPKSTWSSSRYTSMWPPTCNRHLRHSRDNFHPSRITTKSTNSISRLRTTSA